MINSRILPDNKAVEPMSLKGAYSSYIGHELEVLEPQDYRSSRPTAVAYFGITEIEMNIRSNATRDTCS